jgi:alkylation response protein AidB-like acyl-CoA dehydrogenase
MNFEEAEHVTLLRDTLRRFVEKELPREEAQRLDRACEFSAERFARLCELGVTALTVPEEYGGLGVDIVAAVATIEELAKRGSSLCGPYIHCAFYGGMNIVENGSEEQKKSLLPKLAEGKLLFAYGLSEPDVGGDLASAAVTARIEGEEVIINGTKRWCTGAHQADYIYTLVRSGPADDRYRNLSFVLVPANAPGITIVDINHLGLRYAATTDVIFDQVRIPLDHIVGGIEKWDQGWPMLAGRALDVERLEITAVALGIATAAVEDAWQYAQDRRQFGKPICAHQSIRHDLVEARTKLEACRHMLYHAADGEAVHRRHGTGNRADLPAGHGRLRLRGGVRHGALRPRYAVHADRGRLLQDAEEQYRQPARTADPLSRRGGRRPARKA